MTKKDVFINCPFTDDYKEMFQAIVFSIARCGFDPRCAREDDDGGQVRIEKICDIISECRYGVHDISNTELDRTSKLPRFNMPLELGLFLGAKKMGGPKHRSKKAIILDRGPYRYAAFISDIAGQDISAHDDDPRKVILAVVNWLRHEAPSTARIPGGVAVANQYKRFQADLPKIAQVRGLTTDEISFRDLAKIAAEWILKDR
jgi:hypothetical protein